MIKIKTNKHLGKINKTCVFKKEDTTVKRKIYCFLIVLALLIAGCSESNTKNSTATGQKSSKQSEQAKNDTPKEITDSTDTVELKGTRYALFDCDGFKCSVLDKHMTQQIGQGIYKATTNNKFLILKLYIKNDSKEPWNYTDFKLKLIDKQGRYYETSLDANKALRHDLHVKEADYRFGAKINPGLSLIVLPVFEVPKDLDDSIRLVFDKYGAGYKKDYIIFPCKILNK